MSDNHPSFQIGCIGIVAHANLALVDTCRLALHCVLLCFAASEVAACLHQVQVFWLSGLVS